MAIDNVVMRNHLADRYGDEAVFGALFTADPGSTIQNEVTGGSPAYARKALVWSVPSASVSSVTVVFDVPANVTVWGAGVVSTASGAGTMYDAVAIGAGQAFASQGTYSVTFQVTVT